MQIFPTEPDSPHRTQLMTATSTNAMNYFPRVALMKRSPISKTSRNIFLSISSFRSGQTNRRLAILQTRSNLGNLFRNQARKVMNVLGFIRELKAYSDLLRTQHQDYKYRKRSILPFYPDDLAFQLWMILIKIVHFMSCIIFPLDFAFQFDGSVYVLSNIACILFGLDIIFHFISCHIDLNNNLIHKYEDIISFYLKGWFILDVISILPYQYFFGFEMRQNLNLLRLLRVIKRFIHVKRLNYKQTKDIITYNSKIVDSLSYIDEWAFRAKLQQLCFIFIDMMILTHIFACLYLWSTVIDSENKYSWLYRYSMHETSSIQQYLFCFYWAFETITTIGYGDIQIVTNYERVIGTIWIFFGVGFYSFSIGNLTIILIKSNKDQELEDELASIEDLSTYTYIPSDIVQELYGFINFNTEQNPLWLNDSRDILYRLPHTLKQFTAVGSYREVLKSIPFLSFDINFTTEILPFITFMKYEPMEIIYYIGQQATDVYFLLQGDVRLLNKQGKSILTIMEGTIFGEIECMEQQNRLMHAGAVRKSLVLICPGRLLFKLSKTDLLFELEQLYKRRKFLILEYEKQKIQDSRKLRRYKGVVRDDEQLIAASRPRLSEQLNSQLAFDKRTYQMYQQDLLLKVLGLKKAKARILRDKFQFAVNRIKGLIKRSKKKDAYQNDPERDIMMRIINNRLPNARLSRKIGKKMLSNFKKVRQNEEKVQSVLNKAFKQTLDRIQTLKLKDIIGNQQRKSNLQKLCQSKYYISQEKTMSQKKSKNLYGINQQMKSVINSTTQLSRLFSKISMSKFEIIQDTHSIEDIIEQIQLLVSKI